MNVEYRVKEWHTGSVHAGETGALGLQAMLNEPELLGYRLHTVLGGLDQSLLIFAKETEDRPGSDAETTDTRDSAVAG
jgi:hypothetical protein